MGILLGLAVLWLVLVAVGFLIKGLIWLGIIALVAFVATAIAGLVTALR